VEGGFSIKGLLVEGAETGINVPLLDGAVVPGGFNINGLVTGGAYKVVAAGFEVLGGVESGGLIRNGLVAALELV
jgi:hypothetical protein